MIGPSKALLLNQVTRAQRHKAAAGAHGSHSYHVWLIREAWAAGELRSGKHPDGCNN